MTCRYQANDYMAPKPPADPGVHKGTSNFGHYRDSERMVFLII